MPFLYNRHSNKIAIGMPFLPWLVGILRFAVNVSLKCLVYTPTHNTCIASGSDSTSTSCKVSTSVFTWILGLTSIAVPIALYVIMYLKGRQLNNQLVISEEMKKARKF